MKINPRNIDRFLNNGEFTEFKSILFYGNNTGLIQNHIESICKVFLRNVSDEESLNKLKMKYSDVSKEPDLLLNEIKTTSLFCSKKIILINEVSGTITKQLEEALSEERSSDVLVIFYGDQIAVKDKVQKFFETSPDFASIPCYLEEAQDLEREISSRLRKEGVRIENPEAIKYIANNISGDRLSIETELDKIISSYKKEDKISNIEIKNIISKSSADTNADKYIAFLMQEDFLSSEAELEKLILSDVKLSFIVRALSRYFTKLYLAHGLIADGIPEAEVPSKLKPPIFFKNVPSFKLAMKKYSASKTIDILERLLLLEIQIKSNDSNLAKIIFEKELFNIFTLKASI
jgi:DNA polymerase-3 subunit delta